jgi:hypothetical protein
MIQLNHPVKLVSDWLIMITIEPMIMKVAPGGLVLLLVGGQFCSLISPAGLAG